MVDDYSFGSIDPSVWDNQRTFLTFRMLVVMNVLLIDIEMM